MNTNLSTALSACLLLILVFLLLYPLLAVMGLVRASNESYENRKLAEFPTQVSSLEDYIKWPRRVDDFLADHLPNRGTLLKLNAWIRYYVFGTSPVDSVLVGQDGWLFHRMPADMEEIEGRLVRKPYQIRRLRVVLEERRDWLEEQGVDYIVLIAPTKQTVYPEKLPKWVKPGASGSSRRELLISELRHSGSTLSLFDFTPVLREAKTKWEDALYYRQDSHWTYRGALQAYTALTAFAPKWFRAPANDWIEELVPRESNLMHLMGLPGSELAFQPQPPGGFAARPLALDMPLLKSMAKRGVAMVFKRPDLRGPRLYFMGDSFAGWNAGYLAENFSRTVLTNTWGEQWQRHEQFPVQNILVEQPDLVVDQMLENRLDLGNPRGLLGDPGGENHPAEVRSARLRRLFSQSRAVSSEHLYEGNEIKITLPSAVGQSVDALIVRLDLEASAPTHIESVSPYPASANWDDLCLRGGELTRRAVGPGRSEVLLCAVQEPGTGVVRVRLNSESQVELQDVSVTVHPDL
jgi:hypothetical protein